MVYDKQLKADLCKKRRLAEIWEKALLGQDFSYSTKLKPLVELAKSAGRIHEVHAWASFWKQPQAPWRLTTVNRRAGIMGVQHDFPDRVYFDDAETVLRYLGQWPQFTRWQERCQKLVDDFDALSSLCVEYREAILADAALTDSMWHIARYFSGTVRTGCYLRELDIPHVDTKFIEKNDELTAKIFYALQANPAAKRCSFKELRRQLQWRRKAPTPNIYLRSLDADKTIGGLQELMVTAEQLARLQVPFGRIFFSENKVNGFVFPQVKDGLMIFGAGNGVVAGEAAIPWLEQHPQLWYWGDIDRNGLQILARVREKYPQVRSFLMQKELAARYSHFMTADTSVCSCLRA